MDSGADDLAAVGVLAEPRRSRIYTHLAAATQPQTQQEVCDGLGRTLVAFHLDKLQRAGLVRLVRAEAAAGARGRPPQRYAVSDREVIATVPPRRYELLAEVLVRATREQAPGELMLAAAVRVARARGAELAREESDCTADGCEPQEVLTQLLSRLGYEPRHDEGTIVLTNCPFQRLRIADTELVCSINLAVSAGYLDGLAMSEAVTARLRPCPVNCCVVLERTA
jgi:predicted ArsR family transcriptional regulator